MQEVLVGQEKDSTMWEPRAADPGLEAEFLSRLMVRLGADKTEAKTEMARAEVQPTRAKLVSDNGSRFVQVDEDFEHAWRRVGLALDRVGFTVEDRDRTKGLYFVRYVDPDQDQSKQKKGFLSRLFSFGSSGDKTKSADRYRIQVREAGTISRVSVLNDKGQPDASRTSDRILALLTEQLR